MTTNMSRVILPAAMMMLFAACGGPGGNASLRQSIATPAAGLQPLPAPAADAAAPAAGLPAVADLPRGTSHAPFITGNKPLITAGSMSSGSSVFLALGEAVLEVPQPVGTEGPPLMSPAPSGLAYAVYQLGAGTLTPTTLKIKTGPNFATKFWVGLANLRRQSWDYAAGSYFSSPEIPLQKIGSGLTDYVSPEGTVSVAIIVDDSTEPVQINSLQLHLATEVENLQASTDRWDGVRLSWDQDLSADSYRIWRRPAAAPQGDWVEVTAEPLEQYSTKYLDLTVPDDGEQEYLVRTGDVRYPNTLPEHFWSGGVTVTGKRRPSTLEEEVEAVEMTCQVNMQNYLSFFCIDSTSDAPVTALRNESFPPSTSWEGYGGEDGLPSDMLEITEGFAVPFQVFPFVSVNNPSITIGYTSQAGTFTQISSANQSGMVAWEEPILVRGPEHVLLDMMRLPRRIGLLTWNQELERMELLDSIDQLGRFWSEFDEEEFPWMVVTSRRPDGVVDVLDQSQLNYIFYREAGTHEVVVLDPDGDNWLDISPGVMAGPAIQLQTVLEHPSLPALILYHVNPEGSELRQIHQNHKGDWLQGSLRVLVEAPEGETVSEFRIATHGTYSPLNYLIYVVDGDVWIRRCLNAFMEDWSDPLLISDSGSCRSIDCMAVGTDESFTESYDYLTFIEDDEQGQPTIRYIDLSTTYAQQEN